MSFTKLEWSRHIINVTVRIWPNIGRSHEYIAFYLIINKSKIK